jgi:hypothetical protein
MLGPSNGLLTPLLTAPVTPHILNWESPSAAFTYQRTTTSALALAPSTNFNSSFALEGEGDFFLNNPSPGILSGGRAIQGLFGPKIGYRTDTVGIFVKARPGFITFSNTFQGINFNPTVPSAFTIETGRLTEPALDLGTVIEIYPSRHWAWRTDLGDTMIFYRSVAFFGITLPGSTQNNFQFSTGFQYRF